MGGQGIGREGQGVEEMAFSCGAVVEMGGDTLLQELIDCRRQAAEVEFVVIVECSHIGFIPVKMLGDTGKATSVRGLAGMPSFKEF